MIRPERSNLTRLPRQHTMKHSPGVSRGQVTEPARVRSCDQQHPHEARPRENCRIGYDAQVDEGHPSGKLDDRCAATATASRVFPSPGGPTRLRIRLLPSSRRRAMPRSSWSRGISRASAEVRRLARRDQPPWAPHINRHDVATVFSDRVKTAKRRRPRCDGHAPWCALACLSSGRKLRMQFCETLRCLFAFRRGPGGAPVVRP